MIWVGSALGNWTVLLRALVISISPASIPDETRSRLQVTSRASKEGILPSLNKNGLSALSCCERVPNRDYERL